MFVFRTQKMFEQIIFFSNLYRKKRHVFLKIEYVNTYRLGYKRVTVKIIENIVVVKFKRLHFAIDCIMIGKNIHQKSNSHEILRENCRAVIK